MKEFNLNKLSREELMNSPKEEVVNKCLYVAENYKLFIDTIFTATTEQFEDMKKLYNILNMAVKEEDR